MILRLRMRERDYKTLGASIIYSLLSPHINKDDNIHKSEALKR